MLSELLACSRTDPEVGSLAADLRHGYLPRVYEGECCSGQDLQSDEDGSDDDELAGDEDEEGESDEDEEMMGEVRAYPNTLNPFVPVHCIHTSLAAQRRISRLDGQGKRRGAPSLAVQ